MPRASRRKESDAGSRKPYQKFGDLLVLDDISTKIYEGEKVVIVGPSGGGKSTFLRCLNVLEDPTAGRILLWATTLPTLKST